jgi:hypothetical protein
MGKPCTGAPIAFDKTQAKGSFKVTGDDVAQKLESDIILPKSSVKPEYRGPIVVGIRDGSRDLQFKSSYTPVEHAPGDSIELEIKAHALQQIE